MCRQLSGRSYISTTLEESKEALLILLSENQELQAMRQTMTYIVLFLPKRPTAWICNGVCCLSTAAIEVSVSGLSITMNSSLYWPYMRNQNLNQTPKISQVWISVMILSLLLLISLHMMCALCFVETEVISCQGIWVGQVWQVPRICRVSLALTPFAIVEEIGILSSSEEWYKCQDRSKCKPMHFIFKYFHCVWHLRKCTFSWCLPIHVGPIIWWFCSFDRPHYGRLWPEKVIDEII